MNSLGQRVGCGDMADLMEEEEVWEVFVVVVLLDDAVSDREELEVESESISRW
jgi:hypothetical protein